MTRIKMSERSNTPDVEVPSVTYAKGYDDPEADMVLRSSDGVLFRVHSYHLKAASAFFRSMTTSNQLGINNDPLTAIDIDGSAIPLTLLLGQVILPKPPMFDNWANVKAVLTLGKRYQFELLPRLLAHSIEPCLKVYPHEVFAFASQHNLETLAKAAIGNFDNVGNASNNIVQPISKNQASKSHSDLHPSRMRPKRIPLEDPVGRVQKRIMLKDPVGRVQKRIKLDALDASTLNGVSTTYIAALVRAMRASEGYEGFVDWKKAASVFSVKK